MPSVSFVGPLPLRFKRDALLRIDAHVEAAADRRAQRRMRARLDRAAPDHHLEVDELAEKYLLVDGRRVDVHALLARLGELDVLRTDRQHDFLAGLERVDAARLQLADFGCDAIETGAIGRAHGAAYEVRGARSEE